MKKSILLIAFMSATIFLFAQNTAKDVFSKDDIVWYGLDFSKAKFVGQFDVAPGAAPATANDIRSKYILEWNNVIINESKKFDLKKTFRKLNVFYDLSVVNKINLKIDEDKMVGLNDFKFENPKTVVENIIKGYGKGEKSEGIGLAFVVEYFNKPTQEASVYVTFFDIAQKEVLFTEKVIGKPHGIGLRNFWAGAVFNILDQIDKTTYKLWKKNYGE